MGTTLEAGATASEVVAPGLQIVDRDADRPRAATSSTITSALMSRSNTPTSPTGPVPRQAKPAFRDDLSQYLTGAGVDRSDDRFAEAGFERPAGWGTRRTRSQQTLGSKEI